MYFWSRIFIHKAYIFVKKLAKRKKNTYFNDFLPKKFVGIKFFFLRNVLVNGPLIDRMWYEWQKKHRFENVWVVVK